MRKKDDWIPINPHFFLLFFCLKANDGGDSIFMTMGRHGFLMSPTLLGESAFSCNGRFVYVFTHTFSLHDFASPLIKPLMAHFLVESTSVPYGFVAATV